MGGMGGGAFLRESDWKTSQKQKGCESLDI